MIIHLGRDPQTGKYRYKWYTHETRREAEVHLAQLLAQSHAGGSPPTTRLTLGQFLGQWLQDYAAGAVGPVTLRTYQDVVRLHLTTEIGIIPLIRLTPQAIQSCLSRLLKKGLSSTTVHKCYRVLREALGHAVRWGLLGSNPALLANPPRPRRREMRVWDEEQIRLFLAEAKRSSPHYLLYLVAVLTGMRQEELLGLRWQDTDLTQGVASVRQTFYRLGGQKLWKDPKSSAARRTVALPLAIVNELQKLREREQEHRAFFGPSYQSHDLVFCQANGNPLHAHNLTQRDFQRIIQQAGLPKIRFHDLRHSHATHLLRLGVHPKVVQERLGHSNPAFTLHVYSHVLPGMQVEAATLVATKLLPKDGEE